MRPVLTPQEMADVDRAAPEPVETLIERAGFAVARTALDLLGGGYGRRVAVVAGKGNNGADGRAAARVLTRAGVRVDVLEAGGSARIRADVDLIVDAAYGTGFNGDYCAPDPGAATVLAVDIPSGVDGLTGVASGDAVWADVTVTFAAMKPGLLLADGPARSGETSVVDIGLDVSAARCHLVEDGDVTALLPRRARDSHKWQSAVLVAAGSPGMQGAARLTAQAAMRAGAGYVRLGSPGVDAAGHDPSEVVAVSLPAAGWHRDVLHGADRFAALAVGPGLGRGADTAADVRAVVRDAPIPVVVDADGLNLLGSASDAAGAIGSRPAATLLTPHDGEFERLTGRPPGDDRIAAARDLAKATGATVLLKGSTTVVAEPSGRALLVASGSARLATAGTGDVLTGMCAAFLARGLDPLTAAGLAAHVHGRAASLGPTAGLVASDLLQLVPAALEATGG